MRDDLKSDIVVDALGMGTQMRRPDAGLVHHSDRGAQYRSLAFGECFRDSGILASMGETGVPHDNAVTESVMATIKKDCVHRHRFKTRDEFPLSQMDQAVRTGNIRLWNEDNDVSAEVSAIVREHEARIAREVERRIGSAANVNGVLFVGGGSALFREISARFRNGIMHDDPEFANARGLHKFGRYINAEVMKAAE